MNYYIDFDNTLYNTSILTERILNAVANAIPSQNGIYEECKSLFNQRHIYNVFELSEYFSSKYNTSNEKIINNISNVVQNGPDLVFDDSIPFLKKLHQEKHNIFLLSYSNRNLRYQTQKILGSGLADYFDAFFITAKPKYELDIDYTNGIFIDDNPDDLLGLYSKNPKKVIRLRRKENKYSNLNINNANIAEYANFNEIQ